MSITYIKSELYSVGELITPSTEDIYVYGRKFYGFPVKEITKDKKYIIDAFEYRGKMIETEIIADVALILAVNNIGEYNLKKEFKKVNAIIILAEETILALLYGKYKVIS